MEFKAGWIVERNGVHQGIGNCQGKLKWVGFNNKHLLVFKTEEAATNFLYENHLGSLGFVCEHSWYKNK